MYKWNQLSYCDSGYVAYGEARLPLDIGEHAVYSSTSGKEENSSTFTLKQKDVSQPAGAYHGIAGIPLDNAAESQSVSSGPC